MVKASRENKRFLIEGVIVNFPGQAKPIRVKKLPLHIIFPKQMVVAGFQPFRLVINMKVVEDANPKKAVTVFKPPIEIRVRYTAADFEAAKNAGGALGLGYWDGKAWTRCAVKLVSSRSPEKGGWLVTTISKWGDPTVAIGS